MIRKTLISATAELGLEMPEELLGSLVLFAEELKKWNRKINLTAIRTDREIAVKHIVDSLYLAREIRGVKTLLDVGSGAGIPAIPLKIVRPEIHVVSVDAVGKKIQFQRHVARLLGLRDFEALQTRIENLNNIRQGFFDVITSRAFSSLGDFVRLACPLLADGGSLIAMKGPAAAGELEEARAILGSLHFGIGSVTGYSLPADSGERCLVTIQRAKFLSRTGEG